MRRALREGQGYLYIQHTAGSIALSSQRDCHAKSWPGSKAGFSPGWLGSATEGRRPQVRGVRSGGLDGDASSTPATHHRAELARNATTAPDSGAKLAKVHDHETQW